KKTFDNKLNVIILGNDERINVLENKVIELNNNISVTKINVNGSSRIDFFDHHSKRIKIDGRDELTYDKLILAPGQNSYLPAIKGIFLDGVCIAKDYEFTKKKIGKLLTLGRTAVIGSSPATFMIAELLKKRGAEKVHLISPFNNLLGKYLDYTASEILLKSIKKHDIELIFGAEIDEIIKENGHKKILLERGKEIAADNIFIESRLKPDIDKALQLGLLVNKGIIVGQQLETNIKDIHSFGSSSEVKGNISGDPELLSKQAETLARIIAGDPTAKYNEKIDVARFKLFELDIISFGEFNSDDEKTNILSYIDQGKSAYKKIVVRNNKIVGGLYVGDTGGSEQILKFARENSDISKYRSSLLSGKLSNELSLGKILCTCMSVSEKEVESAIINGMTIDNIKQNLKAGVTCGTCLQDIKNLYKTINNKH
ncbi:MAG: FAD-dependent oxidoreductase, partial [Thermodesulfobacteriota bacterium]